MHKLGFIGTGKMARALINCLMDKSYSINASDKNKDKLEGIKKLSVNVTNDNKEVISNSDIIFICVKPQDIKEILLEIKDKVKEKHLIVSIAAGISLDYIQKYLPNKRVIRVMPNVLCNVGAMSAAFSPGKYATQEDIKTIENILNSAGISFLVEEQLIDTVTALSGSGPAFVAYIASLLIKEGQEHGLDKETARGLVIQTIFGTAKMLSEKNLDPDDLINMVASPGGTTEAGLGVLKDSEVDVIINKTIESTITRAKELVK